MTTENADLLAKKCTHCGEWKPNTPEYFRRGYRLKDGLYPHCIPCAIAGDKRRTEAHIARRAGALPKNKKCSVCEKTKPTASFHRCASYVDGLTRYCRECTKKRRREYQEKDPERYVLKVREKSRRAHYTPKARAAQKRASAIYSIRVSIALAMCAKLGVDIDKLAKEKYDAEFAATDR